MIEEGDEVFLHLNTVVIHLSYSEDAHLALPPHLQGQNRNSHERSSTKLLFWVALHSCLVPNLMLAEQEGQKHQHPSIMDDPPHIYVAFSEALSI